MKTNFDVTVTKTGLVTIAAENAVEAMKIANKMSNCDIIWDADFISTDAELEIEV